MPEYAITVWTADRDLAYFEVVAGAPAMEQRVAELHKRFPSPQFRLVVDRA